MLRYGRARQWNQRTPAIELSRERRKNDRHGARNQRQGAGQDECRTGRRRIVPFRAGAATVGLILAHTCREPDLCDSDLCIGHVASSRQHAIRASGVDCQPAQTARFPAHRIRTAVIAARRRLRVTTYVGCWTPAPVSNLLGLESRAKCSRKQAGRIAVTVHRVLAVVVLAIFTSLVAADGVCCPDGCTDQAQALVASFHHSGGQFSCALCIGGVQTSAIHALAPAGVLPGRLPFARVLSPTTSAPHPPDHPPRR